MRIEYHTGLFKNGCQKPDRVTVAPFLGMDLRIGCVVLIDTARSALPYSPAAWPNVHTEGKNLANTRKAEFELTNMFEYFLQTGASLVSVIFWRSLAVLENNDPSLLLKRQ